jgi:hypothetical protein
MAISKLDAEGEAWEMRFCGVGARGVPRRRTSRFGRIASVIWDALKFVGYDGMLDPYADS